MSSTIRTSKYSLLLQTHQEVYKKAFTLMVSALTHLRSLRPGTMKLYTITENIITSNNVE